MGQLLLILTSALVVGAVVFGVSVLITGGDPGLDAAEPDGRVVPLPSTRPLAEGDVARTRFDTALRGYRMGQVDQALSRLAYDIGYKGELITVLEAEIVALRSGRLEDAEVLRRARDAALAGASGADVLDPAGSLGSAGQDDPVAGPAVDLGLVTLEAVPEPVDAEAVPEPADAEAVPEPADAVPAHVPAAEAVPEPAAAPAHSPAAMLETVPETDEAGPVAAGQTSPVGVEPAARATADAQPDGDQERRDEPGKSTTVDDILSGRR